MEEIANIPILEHASPHYIYMVIGPRTMSSAASGASPISGHSMHARKSFKKNSTSGRTHRHVDHRARNSRVRQDAGIS